MKVGRTPVLSTTRAASAGECIPGQPASSLEVGSVLEALAGRRRGADARSLARVNSGRRPVEKPGVLRTLFLVPQGRQSPGPRYRIFQFLPHLEALGVQPTVAIMLDDRATHNALQAAIAPRSRALANKALQWARMHSFIAHMLPRFADFDRIVLYRIPVPGWARRPLARHRDRLIFDFDDALDQPEGGEGLVHRLRTRVLQTGLRNAVRAAGLTITSNERNAQVVRALGGRAAVLPTCVDVSSAVFRERKSFGPDGPVLGWIGTPSTSRYLVAIEGALARVARSRRVAIRVVGAGRNPLTHVRAEVREWALETETQEVAAFDIGLMPMPDTPWTRGKAALKALQYGASGAPTVASWTDTNAAILGDGKGTTLCRTEDEWVAAIERLLDENDFRAEQGLRARQHVMAKFSLERTAPRLCELIKTAPERYRGAREQEQPSR